jgi:hypothetical protein
MWRLPVTSDDRVAGMDRSWMLDELRHAGTEHLDPAFVAGFDRKQGWPARLRRGVQLSRSHNPRLDVGGRIEVFCGADVARETHHAVASTGAGGG